MSPQDQGRWLRSLLPFSLCFPQQLGFELIPDPFDMYMFDIILTFLNLYTFSTLLIFNHIHARYTKDRISRKAFELCAFQKRVDFWRWKRFFPSLFSAASFSSRLFEKKLWMAYWTEFLLEMFWFLILKMSFLFLGQ